MDLHKKVIGNAIVSYFLVFVSLSFLWSKQPYLNHPFVKGHVKVAFILHVLLLSVIVIMSYSFLDTITIFEYSLNTIITILLLLAIFAGILYGAFKAYKGEAMTIGEMFHSVKGAQSLLKESDTKDLGEENSLTLILAHIPFIGYIFAGRHPELPHMRDISMLNMMITSLSIFLAAIGSISLASILMLGYIIWSVYQSMRLILSHEFSSLNTSRIPTPREKLILQKSFLSYIGNSLRKKAFVPIKDLTSLYTDAFTKKQSVEEKELKSLKTSTIPSIVFYIPFINIIGVFFMNTQDTHHIKHGLIITLIMALLLLIFDYQSPTLLLVLIPIFYGIGYIDQKSYMMPYIYETAELISSCFSKIFHLGRKTRALQKTDKKVTVKIGEDKK